jgi:uncharacterized membrane protein
MRAEAWAVLTAVCWAGGSYFEKRGVKLGAFTPIMGTTIRTVTSVVVLLVLSRPYWPQVRSAGAGPLLMVILGGGVIAGTMGITFFYNAIAGGNLSVVLPIAFCLTPVIGVVIGLSFLGERVVPLQVLGILLTVAGAGLTVYFKQ